MKTGKPLIPRAEGETHRRAMVSLLQSRCLTARELSVEVHLPEKEVLAHLEHIRAAFRHGEQRLRVSPAVCCGCGFVFSKRERLARPGKCPLCRNQHISEPSYTLR